MIVKCPACGAASSLDAIIANQPAAEALMQVAKLSPLGGLLIRYVGLFRPAKSQLSMARVATLLGELTPMIEAQRIERDGQLYDAPLPIWESALQKILEIRDNGKLSTPLGGHGYLLDIIKTESGRAQPVAVAAPQHTTKKPLSATADAIGALQNMKETV